METFHLLLLVCYEHLCHLVTTMPFNTFLQSWLKLSHEQMTGSGLACLQSLKPEFVEYIWIIFVPMVWGVWSHGSYLFLIFLLHIKKHTVQTNNSNEHPSVTIRIVVRLLFSGAVVWEQNFITLREYSLFIVLIATPTYLLNATRIVSAALVVLECTECFEIGSKGVRQLSRST